MSILFDELIVSFLVHESIDFSRIGQRHLEQPALIIARGIDECRLALDLSILLSDDPWDGRVQLAGSLNTLQGSALVSSRQTGARSGQLSEDDFPQSLLSVIGDTYGGLIGVFRIANDPFVFVCEAMVRGAVTPRTSW